MILLVTKGVLLYGPRSQRGKNDEKILCAYSESIVCLIHTTHMLSCTSSYIVWNRISSPRPPVISCARMPIPAFLIAEANGCMAPNKFTARK